MLQKKLGQRIASLRRDRKLTQERLAELLNCSVEFISLVERGVNAPSVAGLGDFGFTDAPAAGVVVSAIHVTQMRSALDEALGPLGFGTGGYTDVPLTGVVIKAVHFQETLAPRSPIAPGHSQRA